MLQSNAVKLRRKLQNLCNKKNVLFLHRPRTNDFSGLLPTAVTDPQCIVDINPVTPLESGRRKVARAQKQAQNPERNSENQMSKKRIADQADDETVFIPRD